LQFPINILQKGKRIVLDERYGLRGERLGEVGVPKDIFYSTSWEAFCGHLPMRFPIFSYAMKYFNFKK
jgi:hypothetical protein